ncbi:hypothetical protein WAF17_18800 [Bernardetia sp. ABR2-2B]|uniref:hypothetical protein n=1 Tax=Bernardetia sp. ABR2-2B TaxID=3127472 RepID=UPI0030D40FFB
MENNKQQKKQTMGNKIVTICSILFTILLIAQYVVRFINGNEKNRPWDTSTKQEFMNKCTVRFPNHETDSLMVEEICQCCLDKLIENKHSYYEYIYYMSSEEESVYLDPCIDTINEKYQLGKGR